MTRKKAATDRTSSGTSEPGNRSRPLFEINEQKDAKGAEKSFDQQPTTRIGKQHEST